MARGSIFATERTTGSAIGPQSLPLDNAAKFSLSLDLIHFAFFGAERTQTDALTTATRAMFRRLWNRLRPYS